VSDLRLLLSQRDEDSIVVASYQPNTQTVDSLSTRDKLSVLERAFVTFIRSLALIECQRWECWKPAPLRAGLRRSMYGRLILSFFILMILEKT
jgi:hypothetical protein